ncbi:MAG TPA: hypothetical protein ENJ18_06605 [Nannocystis exedens]|nr:hypothetical protein [Nannocystis exedens]
MFTATTVSDINLKGAHDKLEAELALIAHEVRQIERAEDEAALVGNMDPRTARLHLYQVPPHKVDFSGGYQIDRDRQVDSCGLFAVQVEV